MKKVLNIRREFEKKKNFSRFMLILVFSIFFLSTILANNTNATNINWWNESFDYRKNINITSVASINLTDFPIYLNISYESNMQTDYDDLRFLEGNCINSTTTTELDYEIEFNDTNKAIVWIRIPNLQTSGNQICMYYGNSTITTSANPIAVWKPNYGLVYHMDSNGQDSTSNNRDKISNIGTPGTDNSYLGYGISFDGTNAWNLQNIPYWEQEWTQRTHEILFKTSADITTRQTLFAEGGGTNGIMMYIVGGQLYSRWWSESNPNWAGNHFNVSISTNTIYHAAMQLKETGDYGLYLNGNLIMNLSTPDHIDAHSGDGGIAYTGGTSKDYHDLANSAGNYFSGSIYDMRVFDTDESDDWINMSAQNMLNHQTTISYGTEEKLTPTLNITITNPSPITLPLVEQNQTLEVNITIYCDGKSSLNCGNISSYFQFNNTASTYTNISNISTTPIWTASTQPQYCSLTGGNNCTQTWILNLTGNKNQYIKTRLFAKSNKTELNQDYSEILKIKIITGNAVTFNQTILDFERFSKLSGARKNNITITSIIGDNTNISVECKSGDCSTITQNWIDGTNLNETDTKQFTFTCDDLNNGNFLAIFNVTSNEQIGENLITVTCIVDKIYGPIQLTLNKPSTSSITNVNLNKIFKLNATLNCVGECGEVSVYAISGHTLGDGSDGSITITSPNTIVNDYTYLTTDETSGNTIISVNDTTQFSAGDEIMIIQIQNGSGIGSAGNYEYKKIASIGAGTITLEKAIENSYGSGTFNVPSASATQVIRIPQYNDVTINIGSSITAPAWNGYTGGIVIFRATGVVNTLGYINVSQKGFRGGDCNGCGNNAWGDQGEGYLGTGIASLSANGNGGGGGYGPSGFNGEPGAGGAYGTSGSNGISSYTSIGGNIIGTANLSQIFFGGGAGGGGDDDNPAINAQYIDGAGAVIVHAKKIVDAKIESNGENGVGNGGSAGTTGGGAGGTIWLSALDISVSDISAKGGLGFIDSDDIGGDGGDGRIRIDYASLNGSSLINPTQGHNGNISDILNLISTVYGNTPMWTTTSQPQICIPTEDGTCSFSWDINATGIVNSTHNISVIGISNLSQIKINTTLNAEVKIVNVTQIIPSIELISPINNEKIVSNNSSILFKWNVTYSENNTLNCSIYINGIFNTSKLCYTNKINNISIYLTNKNYNWTINATAINNNNHTNISQTYNFTIIKGQHKKISKTIKNSATDIYKIDIEYQNMLNENQDVIITDYVNEKFNTYSFTPGYDITNISTLKYPGNIYLWNLTTLPNSTTSINYSITKTGANTDYYLLKNYIISIE